MEGSTFHFEFVRKYLEEVQESEPTDVPDFQRVSCPVPILPTRTLAYPVTDWSTLSSAASRLLPSWVFSRVALSGRFV